MTLRIASLCSGVGGLDLAVESVLDAELAWYAQYEPPDKHGRPDKGQYAAQIMAHHWPGVPNHGDITAIDYAHVKPVDILTAGFPCQDISLAGKRAGMREGNRSGLWSHVARAVEALRPPLVLIENVRSLTSAPADSDLEFCPRCMGEAGDADPAVPPLRALGAVLGDLADLGFDASWTTVRASDVGAPHKRERVFVLAWPAAEDADEPARGQWRLAAPGQAALGRPRADARGRGGAPAAYAHGFGRRTEGQQRGLRAAQRGEDTLADSARDRRGEGWAEPARLVWRPDAALGGGAPAADSQSAGLETRRQGRVRGSAPTHADECGRGSGEPDDAERQPDIAWGAYEPAIRRWERALGRSAPRPVDDRGRLAAPFVEFLMGLPADWVTGVPGIPRNAQLKALGNGVVPQQAALALRMLLADYEAARQPNDGFGLIRNGTHQQAATGVTCGDSERAA